MLASQFAFLNQWVFLLEDSVSQTVEVNSAFNSGALSAAPAFIRRRDHQLHQPLRPAPHPGLYRLPERRGALGQPELSVQGT